MGGGNFTSDARRSCANGLSPRGRGKPVDGAGRANAARSIPAWAGETPCSRRAARHSGVYPRVGGGNAVKGVTTLAPHGLSPRGRGKPRTEAPRAETDRSIPAWAGETDFQAILKIAQKVYPRVGGGNRWVGYICVRPAGLSPRGRGKPGQPRAKPAQRRSIPAWAGETYLTICPLSRHRVYPRVGGGNAP